MIGKRLFFLVVMLALSNMFSACGKNVKEREVEKETTTESAKIEESQGTQTLLPLESTDFYYGTWRGLFYYDADNDKIESMEEQEGYYITFSETDMVVSNGDDVQSTSITTSDGIQTNLSGSDYFCIYYNDKNDIPVTVILTMMHISGETANGVPDGDYLSVISSNSGAKYMFMEKIHE